MFNAVPCGVHCNGNSVYIFLFWKLGLRPRYSFSGIICFKFSAFCLCSVAQWIMRRECTIRQPRVRFPPGTPPLIQTQEFIYPAQEDTQQERFNPRILMYRKEKYQKRKRPEKAQNLKNKLSNAEHKTKSWNKTNAWKTWIWSISRSNKDK
jgi:hypothetical protein